MPQLKSYHFSLGNSTVGPIGFCARITAESPEQAVARLKEFMPDTVEIRDSFELGLETGEYLNVYLNELAVTVSDIDEVDDIDDQE